MAAVEIKVEDFQKSEVPPVCVFSGVPSENVFRFKFNGIVGGLPVNASALSSLARLRRVILILAVGSVGAFVGASVTGSGLLAMLAIGLMAVALVTTLAARKKLVSGSVTGDRLVLKNVHPAFASAVTGPPLGKCSTCPTLADCPSHQPENCV